MRIKNLRVLHNLSIKKLKYLHMKTRYFLLFLTIFLYACTSHEEDLPDPDPGKEEPVWSVIDDTFKPTKRIALLDLTQRNNEDESGNINGRNLYSAEYMLEIAGTPSFTTKDIKEAIEKGSVILFSSPVLSNTFTSIELDELLEWVRSGGIIVSPALVNITSQTELLFGITDSKYNKLRHSIFWESSQMTEKELEYMDEEEEKSISTGKEGDTSGQAIKSYGYTVSSADVLASFNSGEAAVVHNKLGDGTVYSFGLLWRDIIQRSQLNKDFSASRIFSNGFEPSADIIPLFIRSLYTKHQPTVVWKFTIPDGFQSVLIPTHDCDSRTAYDEMWHMSTYEKKIGLKAHYFITIHYFRDKSYLSAFYDDDAIKKCKELLEDGHSIGSHSIGHFLDFSVTERFPMTIVSKDTYRPTHDITTGITTDGSTWGEVILSKQIIEADLGNKVRSFRTGHLVTNKLLPKAQLEGGYSFSSCFGAGHLLSQFPFQERLGYEWIGELSSVLQMPLHLSDVFTDEPMDEDNWREKIPIWLETLNKLKGNYAPAILLIHPNREWKMRAEEMLVNKMDRSTIGLWNFEDYGDFWLNRRALDFDFCYIPEGNKVLIKAKREEIVKNRGLAFAIETLVVPNEVIIVDENMYGYKLSLKQIADNRFLAIL